MGIKSKISKLIKNRLLTMGFKTKDRIVVFESDDWGSVRNRNKEVIDLIKKMNPELKLDNYQELDCLESEKDIKLLSSTLSSVKNKAGQNAIFTLNYTMANPNFDKMMETDYKEFIYETFAETLKKYNEQNVISSILQNSNIFTVGLHGLEHLNVEKLMLNLKNDTITQTAFKNRSIGFDKGRYSCLDALNSIKTNNGNKIKKAIEIFNKCWGVKPQTFIAPCYVWDAQTEQELSKNNIKILQGRVFQNVPKRNGGLKRKIRIAGKLNKLGQVYLIRNCQFETSKYYLKGETVEKCVADTLKEIDYAFRHNKPAIICTHRVNFVSGIDENNSVFGRNCLQHLLKEIVRLYPNVKFMDSVSLGNMIINKMD